MLYMKRGPLHGYSHRTFHLFKARQVLWSTRCVDAFTNRYWWPINYWTMPLSCDPYSGGF